MVASDHFLPALNCSKPVAETVVSVSDSFTSDVPPSSSPSLGMVALVCSCPTSCAWHDALHPLPHSLVERRRSFDLGWHIQWQQLNRLHALPLSAASQGAGALFVLAGVGRYIQQV
jgi:hypothetical protein